jgi:hypothetical protein
LIAVCVLAIMLGCMGLITGLTSFVALVAAPQLNQEILNQLPEQQAKLQSEMIGKVNAVTARWRPLLYAVNAARVALAVLLLTTAIMTIGWKPLGRTLLSTTMLLGIAFEVLKAVPEGLLQYQNQKITGEYMGRIMASGKAGPGADAMGEALSSGILFMTIAMLVGWTAAKIIYYALSARYLRSSQVRAQFATE